MSNRSYNRSTFDAYMDLDILTALALMVFAVCGLVMTGLALDVVEMLTSYKFLPLAASMFTYAVVFASSGTRNPQHYHPAEWIIVTLTGAFMIGNAFLVEVQDMVTANEPFASIAMLLLMIVTGAVLAK